MFKMLPIKKIKVDSVSTHKPIDDSIYCSRIHGNLTLIRSKTKIYNISVLLLEEVKM
jgi:hypothetical protein